MRHGASNQQSLIALPSPRPRTVFGPLADPLVAVLLAVLWVVLLLRFQLGGEWDLSTSGLFFDAANCAATASAESQRCRGFPLSGVPALSTFRELMHPVPAILGIVTLVLLIVELRMGGTWRNPGVRLKAVLVATLIAGPGLIVNGVLKAHWGRPRPWMTEDFGGWLPFVEAGVYSNYCTSGNCSFVSGEAAAAGWLMCLALVLAVHRYRAYAIVVGLLAIAMAGLRVGFGAHYLSDVVLGFLMTVVIFAAFAALAEWSVSRRARSG